MTHVHTNVFNVVIGNPRNYQIRVIKLIRGSKILKQQTIFFVDFSHYADILKIKLKITRIELKSRKKKTFDLFTKSLKSNL